ncbi:MAG: glycosyltransferase [Micavibrio sp.]
MPRPLVTIITPTYNRADLLPETIESVLRQDYDSIEYIVLDDGSTDNTGDVIKPYLGRLKYLYHDNMGETATVNKGFEMAGGEIICVINSDDPFFADDAISIAVDSLENNPDALMAYPDWVLIDEKGRELSRRALPQYTIETMLIGRNVAIGPGMFIRKSTIEKIGPRDPSIKYVGDLDYSFRMASVGKILHIPRFLATHRVHTQSLSSSAKGPRMAREVLGLGVKYIDKLPLPAGKLDRNKNRILAKWYLTSIYYADIASPRLALNHISEALRLSPLAVLQMFLLFLLDKLKWPFSKIWKSIKRT